MEVFAEENPVEDCVLSATEWTLPQCHVSPLPELDAGDDVSTDVFQHAPLLAMCECTFGLGVIDLLHG